MSDRGSLYSAVSLFLVATFALHFLPVKQAYSSSCDYRAFTTCRDTFNLQGCIDACPYVPVTCPPGTPPDTDCKETDRGCSDACWDKGTEHGSSCASANNCTLEEIQAELQGKSLSPPPPSPTPYPPSPTPSPTSPSPKQTVHTVEDSEFTGETEALVNTKPQKNAKLDMVEPKGNDMGVITSISGETEVLLPDGTLIELSKEVKNGTISLPYGLPEKAQIFTGDETIVRIGLRGGARIAVDPLSEFTMDKFNVDRSLAQPSVLTRMRLKTGKVDVDIQKGEFTSDMKIATPANTGAVTGTHFAVAYDGRTGRSIFEIYDGTIKATNDKTNKTISLTSSYDKPIKRAEISDDGEISLKVAIPKDQWGMDKTENRVQDSKILITTGFSLVTVIILALILLRKKLKKQHYSVTLTTVKINRSMKIIFTLIVGLLLGYIARPFINLTQQPALKPEAPVRESKPVVREGWKTFEDKAYSISFEYPNEWTINRESRVFEQGDLVDIRKFGETQREQTEFYDGGRFTVMTPLATNDGVETWVNSKTSADDQISDVTIHGVAFKKIYTCGLGCFTYYYAVMNGKVYGINTFAEGSKKDEYQEAINQMLNTLVLPK